MSRENSYYKHKYRELLKAIEDIKAEIRKPLIQERFFDTENAKAQAIALSWCLEIIDKHIKETPTERTGHWIYRNGNIPYKWKCDQCSAEFKTDFNYCPNCGARMVEPQESEDGDSDE